MEERKIEEIMKKLEAEEELRKKLKAEEEARRKKKEMKRSLWRVLLP